MAHVIAVAGKGGVGKTTLTGLFIQRLCESGKGPLLVVDNEAGMEHISRGTLPKIDTMFLVSDCSRRGIQAAGRIAELVKEQDINPSFMGLIVNRAPDGKLNTGTAEEIKKQGLKLLGVIPQDEEVYQYDCDGQPTVELPEGSLVREALDAIIHQLKL